MGVGVGDHFSVLRILAVIGIYGPHFMIVMVFVTQNNFEVTKTKNI